MILRLWGCWPCERRRPLASFALIKVSTQVIILCNSQVETKLSTTTFLSHIIVVVMADTVLLLDAQHLLMLHQLNARRYLFAWPRIFMTDHRFRWWVTRFARVLMIGGGCIGYSLWRNTTCHSWSETIYWDLLKDWVSELSPKFSQKLERLGGFKSQFLLCFRVLIFEFSEPLSQHGFPL